MATNLFRLVYRPVYLAFYVAIFVAIAFPSMSSHSVQQAPLKKLKVTKAEFYRKLRAKKANDAEKEIHKVCTNIDLLFNHAVVKIQTQNQDGTYGQESTSTLRQFLSSPHSSRKIIKIVEKKLRRSLTAEEIEIIRRKRTGFPDRMRALWQKKILTERQAHDLIIENNPLTSQELIRLIENGAVKTTNQFVQLRTGANYGDVPTLFDRIEKTVAKIKLNGLPNISDDQLEEDPLAPEIHEAFVTEGLPVPEVISDAMVIRELRRHLLFITSLGMPIRFRPGNVDFQPNGVASMVAPDTNTGASFILSPRTISAALVGNYYINSANASITNGLFVNPLGISYSGSLNLVDGGVDWWLGYTDGYLGIGGSYTANFANGNSLSAGDPTFVSIGANVGGWDNYLTAGVSMSTMLVNSIGMGVSASTTISRSHKATYMGQYPEDGKIASIRGQHGVEIEDFLGKSFCGTVAVSAGEVPLQVAFRASTTHTKRKIYRTHTTLTKAQSMLMETDGPGILYLMGKEIKETRIPSWEKPHLLVDGDELIETKVGRLTGAFVIGLETVVPIHAARVGGTVEVTGEFELGLRKYPNQKYEVSIEPKQIHEMGIFASMLNIFGAGYVKSMAVARKQIFAFDFNNPEAKRAYFALILDGRLPISEEIEVYSEDRGPEYLLTEFRIQNESLKSRGIARTFLEKVRIKTTKKHIGMNAPLIPAVVNVINKIDEEARKQKEHLNLRFEGIDREFVRSHAKSVSTNGVVAVQRHTFGGRRSEGQGCSGRYNQDLFVIHRRRITTDENNCENDGNKWQFDGLSVQAQLEDTIITGDEENKMVELINRLFSAFIGSFEFKNSKSPRTIYLERELSRREFNQLTQPETRDRIPIASQTTGISQQTLTMLLKKLKGQQLDHQGMTLHHFIETSAGFTGFAAIHQLLGAKPEHLYVRTESGYSGSIASAKTFIARYRYDQKSDRDPLVNISPLDTHKNKDHIKKFYDDARAHLRDIDNQLRLLYDDKFLVDDDSLLATIYSKEFVNKLVEAGIRQNKTPYQSALVSARKTILELLNLKTQNFTEEERIAIYKTAKEKRLRLSETAELLLHEHAQTPIDLHMEPADVRKRLRVTWDFIKKIDERLKEIDSDNVMAIMDKAYVDNLITELTLLRDELARSASLAHLNPEEKRKLQVKVNRGMFRRKSSRNFHVDGALAKTYSTTSPYSASHKDPNEIAQELWPRFCER